MNSAGYLGGRFDDPPQRSGVPQVTADVERRDIDGRRGLVAARAAPATPDLT
jgi:hypothetical protein